MIRKLFSLVLVTVLLVMVLPVTTAQEELPTIAQLVEQQALLEGEEAEFTILLAALQAADPVFLERLSDPEIVAATFTTVFAPTDAAFLALFETLGLEPGAVLADSALVNTVLSYHVLPGIFTAADLAARDGAYWGTFAPHTALQVTLDGETVLLDESQVIAADLPAQSGIVHVIDKVLVPDTLGAEMAMDEMPEETLYDLLQSREEFSYFLEAMDLLGFQLDLQVTRYTLFLPTNDVFDAFLEAQGITKDELFANTDTITPVLFYHFLSGEFNSTDLANMAGMMTEDSPLVFGTQQPGTFMTLSISDEGVVIDPETVSANVVEADIQAANGVIHVIDQILLPSGS